MSWEEVVVDTPLNDPEEDLLGYKELAENMAEILCRNRKGESMVFALCGAWGSGKSTFLNFVLNYLSKKPPQERPIIIRFNPWWFTGHADLLDRFLQELRMSFEQNKLKKLAAKVADYVAILSEFPEPILKVGSLLIMKSISEKKQPVWEAKEQICTLLRKQERHIVVVVDDIDRLSADEIKDLFRTIKAITDFPNMDYLLAFDRQVVTEALKELQGLSGEEYLAKIVQVTFDLPIPDKTALRKLFYSLLDRLLAETPKHLIDRHYFENLFYDGIDYFLRTVRDVKRLINSLVVDYPLVRGEVNPQDFIAIETIRTFLPSLYQTIRKEPEMFAVYSGYLLTDTDIEKLRNFHEGLFNELEEQDKQYVKDLLKRLFPRLEGIEGIFGSIRYGEDWEPEWRKKLRICSLDCFPIYFRFNLPEGNPSDAEIRELLALTADQKAFGNRLIELSHQHNSDGTTRVASFFRRLWDFADKDILKYVIPNIFGAIFDVGDQLLMEEVESTSSFSLRTDVQISRLLFRLLKRYDTQHDRFKVLQDAFAAGRAVSLIVRETSILGQQHGKDGAKERPTEEQLIGRDHLDALEKIALQKIKEAAEKGDLIGVPNLARILYCWRDWEADDAPKNWIMQTGLLTSDENLADLLVAFLTQKYIQREGDRVFRRHWCLNPRSLEPFLNPSAIISTCESLLNRNPEWLTGRRKIAVETFIRDYHLVRMGRDPEEVWEDG